MSLITFRFNIATLHCTHSLRTRGLTALIMRMTKVLKNHYQMIANSLRELLSYQKRCSHMLTLGLLKSAIKSSHGGISFAHFSYVRQFKSNPNFQLVFAHLLICSILDTLGRLEPVIKCNVKSGQSLIKKSTGEHKNPPGIA